MLADRGHDSDCLRQALLIQRILPFIPSRIGRKAHQQTDRQRYQDRNRIERMFNRLRQMRRIATRYDKTALSFHEFPQPRRRKTLDQISYQRDLVMPTDRLNANNVTMKTSPTALTLS